MHRLGAQLGIEAVDGCPYQLHNRRAVLAAAVADDPRHRIFEVQLANFIAEMLNDVLEAIGFKN